MRRPFADALQALRGEFGRQFAESGLLGLIAFAQHDKARRYLGKQAVIGVE